MALDSASRAGAVASDDDPERPWLDRILNSHVWPKLTADEQCHILAQLKTSLPPAPATLAEIDKVLLGFLRRRGVKRGFRGTLWRGAWSRKHADGPREDFCGLACGPNDSRRRRRIQTIGGVQ